MKRSFCCEQILGKNRVIMRVVKSEARIASHLCREWAKHALNDVELVDLAFTLIRRGACDCVSHVARSTRKSFAHREKRLAVDQFTHDTSDGPDVDTVGVHGGSEQQLRSAIPAGRDVVGELLRMADRTCETKVAEFERRVPCVDQHCAAS